MLQDYNSDQDGLCDDGRYYYLGDANFNVTTLLDTAGDALEHYVYDPYGKVTAYKPDWSDVQYGFPYGFRFGYTGREHDLSTGFYYYRNRYYHPELGRFLSRDPIGYGGGDKNLYRYVGNAAPSRSDPKGLRFGIPLVGPMLPPLPRFKPGCCGKEVGGLLDAARDAAERKFLAFSYGGTYYVCMGKDGPWAWDIFNLLNESKYQYSTGGCGTKDCRGTVAVHGECHWASDVNYFLWGWANHLCASRTWYLDGEPWVVGRDRWTEGFAVRMVYAWRTLTWWYGDGTTAGRVAWTRAGYHGITNVPSVFARGQCALCGKTANGCFRGHIGDHLLDPDHVVYF